MKKSTDLQALFRAIPSVQQLLQSESLNRFPVSPIYLKRIIQSEIDNFRQQLNENSRMSPEAVPAILEKRISQKIQTFTSPTLRRAINATGIILHTNMGRAPLATSAIAGLLSAAEHYCSVEFDLDNGKRGSRMSHVEHLICLITGAEAAVVVNNCAAAIFLTLSALCRRKEVPVSRGELVEIGGSFRIPEVMKSSGAKMLEIGTTNKTRLADYRAVISPKTGALLKVHTSNYRIVGFTESASLAELAELAKSHDIPLIYDMGSGALTDPKNWGLSGEPLAGDVLNNGTDVITFSGDKLLGGPQTGIIAGKKRFVEKIRKHHLARALRCDKLILAALAETLRLYLQPETLTETLPAAKLLSMEVEKIQQVAEHIVQQINNPAIQLDIIETVSQVGSGALPLEQLPSIAVRIFSANGTSADQLSQRLRENEPPVIGYIQDDALLLNLRTVREDEVPIIIRALNSL